MPTTLTGGKRKKKFRDGRDSESPEYLKYANSRTSTKTQTHDPHAHTHRIARKTLQCVSKGLQTQRLAIISWHFFNSHAP